MSGNGSNDWGVSFGSIKFLEQILMSHNNVEILDRHDDIVFEIRRKKQGDALRVLCIEKYAASTLDVRRAMQEFGPLNVIYIGGKWNSPTPDAQALCNENRIGIYNAGGISAAIRRDQYWHEPEKDEAGRSESHEESA